MDNVLNKPLTLDEIRQMKDENNYVTGHISIDLSDAINNEFEEFLDMIAEKFVDNTTLWDINYKAIGVTPDGEIILHVSGDVSMILEMNIED